MFGGYTKGKDETGDTLSVVLVEVKKGKGKLSREESLNKWDGQGTGLLADHRHEG